MRDINLIVIHCSASANGKPVTAEEIDAWHKLRGFKRTKAPQASRSRWLKHIGYHYVVLLDGTLAIGRGLDEIGAHTSGHNAKSIGICMVGLDAFKRPQWDALKRIVRQLLNQCPTAKVTGHRDLSPDLDGDGVVEKHEWLKTCPGFDVATWLKFGMEPVTDHIFGEPR